MIDVTEYTRSTRVTPYNGVGGGQELILHEIMGLIPPRSYVWLPFYSSGTLAEALMARGDIVLTDHEKVMRPPTARGFAYQALYFGTPTIVHDRPLFHDPVIEASGMEWHAGFERNVVRAYVREAVNNVCCRIIVSGLGSGDISVAQRIADMGDGAKVVAYKDFGTFEDWVIARRLR